MKFISWNVNGIRAISNKGFFEWFSQQNADVVCIQETKARADQLTEELLHPMGYHSFFHSAQRPGYSSVAMYCKKEPQSYTAGLGIEEFDAEGRVQSIDTGDVVLINAYFPNSQEAGARLPYKLRFCEAMLKHCQKLMAQGKHVLLCGDYNIAHKPIDLTHPKANEKNAGYLPEERSWMDTWTNAQFVDCFREFEKGPGHYTWWSYRANARAKNVGWRIDYFCSDSHLRERLASMKHQPQVMGSDHCPIELTLR